jgi:protein arginine kinase activator
MSVPLLMKCDLCSQDATVFLTQVINNQMTTVNLCDDCAKKKGVTDTMGFGLADAFIGPASGQVATVRPAVLAAPSDACPACGFTYSQLKKIGRMGCPECYSAFREGLGHLLSAMHKGTKHVGKKPGPVVQAPVTAEDLDERIEALRQQIQTAVREERYEDAARCKGEIDRLVSQRGVL